jgi:hypothetical protein
MDGFRLIGATVAYVRFTPESDQKTALPPNDAKGH